jgi:hypothetical protein
MGDPYRSLAIELAAHEIRCHFQTRGQMVLSRQMGPIWPDDGNSFWVTRTGNSWYLFTWSPVGYRVPGSVEMAALCRTCMARGDSAMADVPSDIAHAFGLVQLSASEMEAVNREMGKGAS